MSAIRWRRVLTGAIGLTALTLAGLTLADRLLHRIRVTQSDGVWCVRVTPDGKMQRLYGSKCEQP